MKGLQLVKDNKFNLVKTFFVYLTYFCIGSITTLLGSSLLDLQILANTDFAKISLLIPIRSGGHIVGSAIGKTADFISFFHFSKMSLFSCSWFRWPKGQSASGFINHQFIIGHLYWDRSSFHQI